MALNATAMGTQLFADYVVAFPAAAAAYRRNPEQSLTPHNPIEELLKILASVTVTNVSSIVTFVGVSGGVPPVLGTTVGPGVVAPAPPYQLSATFPSLAAVKAASLTTVGTSLGWVGPDAGDFLQTIIDAIFDYVATNVSLQFAPPPAQTLGSGGTMVVTTDGPSLAALTAALPAAVAAALSASPYFKINDDPTLTASPPLISWCTTLMNELGTLLGSQLTTVAVLPVGALAPTAITSLGAML